MNTNENPLISIIIPVYKVEKYLSQCLDSVLAQTFTDWECILVDDGSPDESGKICDEYALQDSRFRVIHQKNGGVSAARNTGLDKARGEWITFVDSDDWIEPEMLTALSSVKNLSSTELIICSLNDTLGTGTFILPSDIEEKDWRNTLCSYLQSACAKAFRLEIINTNNLRFPIGIKLGEDTYFVYTYLSHIRSISFIKEPFYTYFISNEDSATHHISEDIVKDFENLVRKLEKYIAERKRSEEFTNCLYNLKMNVRHYYLFKFKKPYFEKWRNCFPEINTLILKNVQKPLTRLFYKEILLYHDFRAYLIWLTHKYIARIKLRRKHIKLNN